MSPRDSEPRARAHEGPDPLDLSRRIALRAEKASDCAARLAEWERAEAMREVRRLLCVALRRMTARERRVLYCRYWVGLTLEEAGASMGISRERVRWCEAAAMRRLRRSRRGEVRVAGALLGLCPPPRSFQYLAAEAESG